MKRLVIAALLLAMVIPTSVKADTVFVREDGGRVVVSVDKEGIDPDTGNPFAISDDVDLILPSKEYDMMTGDALIGGMPIPVAPDKDGDSLGASLSSVMTYLTGYDIPIEYVDFLREDLGLISDAEFVRAVSDRLGTGHVWTTHVPDKKREALFEIVTEKIRNFHPVIVGLKDDGIFSADGSRVYVVLRGVTEDGGIIANDISGVLDVNVVLDPSVFVDHAQSFFVFEGRRDCTDRMEHSYVEGIDYSLTRVHRKDGSVVLTLSGKGDLEGLVDYAEYAPEKKELLK